MNTIDLNFPKISQEEWKQLVQAELIGKDFNETLVWKSLEGLNVKPYFSTEDVQHIHYAPLQNKTKTAIISQYNDLFFNDVDGFLINKESGQGELYNKMFFFSNYNFKANQKGENYLLYDLFSRAENNADYKLDTEQANHILADNIYIKNLLADVSLHQNAGANIIQQLGIALAKANEYINVLGKKSLEKIFFRFSIGYNYFFEIAKLRAFRILWSNFISHYNIDNFQIEPFILCESSLRNKSVTDCENNLIRSAFEGAAAVIGNADALYLHDYSEWNSDNSINQEIAYKQQLILREENILHEFNDAMKGSYYVENITNFLIQNGWKFFQEIEKEEGYLKSLEKGFIQKRIISQAKKEQEAFDNGQLVLIGVNKFAKIPAKDTLKIKYNHKIINKIRLAESME